MSEEEIGGSATEEEIMSTEEWCRECCEEHYCSDAECHCFCKQWEFCRDEDDIFEDIDEEDADSLQCFFPMDDQSEIEYEEYGEGDEYDEEVED